MLCCPSSLSSYFRRVKFQGLDISIVVFKTMAPLDVKADAKRVFDVLKAGGIALLPGDVGYFLVAGNFDGVAKIFSTKNRGAHKRHPTIGSLELQRELHTLTPEQGEIIKHLTEDIGLPLAVVGRYRPDHAMMKHFDEESLDASSADGTIHMAINVGSLANELARLAHAENFLLQGSSANPSGTGNKFRLEDVPEEIKSIADIVIDYGLAKYSVYGLGSTILGFGGDGVEVLRVGVCYDVIRDVLKRFWGITLPEDPGRASAPHGNLKDLPPSESLKKLIGKREGEFAK